jgi:uncharacterized protein YegL
MANPVSLILRKDPVTARQPVPARTPDIAVVYATADGQLDLLRPDMRDGRVQRMFARYRVRYEVDMGDHRRTAQLSTSKLRSAEGTYEFETSLDIGFRVHDPIKIIERNVTDPLAVVYGHILAVCNPIARRYRIDSFADAEDAINQRFAAQSGEHLPEGILIYRCVARVAADPQTLQYLRSVQDSGRSTVMRTQQHTAAVSDARRGNELAEIRQTGELNRRAAEHDAMGRQALDIDSLMRMHLAQHPEDTLTAARLLQDYHQSQFAQGDLQQQRIADMFRFLVDKGLVHPVDVDQYRNQAISQAGGGPALPAGRQAAPFPAVVNAAPAPHALTPAPAPAVPAPAGPPSSAPAAATAIDWDAPLPATGPSTSAAPAASAPPTSSPTTSSPAPGSPAPAPVPAHAVPVYLVLDTSAALGGVADEFEKGLSRLVDALGAQPAQTAGVHLAIVGAAETGTTLKPLGPVVPDTPRPRVRVGGPLHAAAVLEHVGGIVAHDVPVLKAAQPRVRRPHVIVLIAGDPADGDQWPAAHERLTDRRYHPFAPRVTAFGTGGATPATVARLATSPELAFTATATDIGTSLSDFFAQLQTQLLAYARSALDNQPEPAATVPPGFCAAACM